MATGNAQFDYVQHVTVIMHQRAPVQVAEARQRTLLLWPIILVVAAAVRGNQFNVLCFIISNQIHNELALNESMDHNRNAK